MNYIKELAGHSSIKTTEIYLHNFRHDLNNFVSGFKYWILIVFGYNICIEKIIKHNGKTYYHASKYREEKKISYQQMNNLLHGKKYKKRYVKKAKDNDSSMMEKKVEYNYIAAPKFKKGVDYIVRGGFIYVSEELFGKK